MLIDKLGIYLDFNLEVIGFDVVWKLVDYRYIDIDNSIFNIIYGDF